MKRTKLDEIIIESFTLITKHDFVSLHCWLKMANILHDIRFEIEMERGKKMMMPSYITKGPDKDIDIVWRSKDNFRLLINVDKQSLATYYGDGYDNNEIEGNIIDTCPEEISKFLINNYEKTRN